ncbi:hypothetical protein Halha_2298 [Halobacteroides halobius DSM 5150]|uniref:Uncharacterized protein n=1 Tax=Halobacteroides halobius (strain ATCC 35273 / DSM 5150 / MD-1) TaxID=748449 RepID=L0KA36_HALHC|nr:hypothetical protein [Halobacteroides halobius]AGB42172.1 hypothetical protein Halha_2298 [Halobacteroides halobius DSM 5150]
MKKAFIPTLNWLIFNTLAYIIYFFMGWNKKIELFFRASKLIKIPLLENNPLPLFYLISMGIIIVIGLFDTYIRAHQQETQEKEDEIKHRRYYSTPS